jgi:chromate reductase
MQQPEAYLGHVSDDSFDDDGCLKEGPLKTVVTKLAHAFHDWVETILRARELLEHDPARTERATKKMQPA